MQTLREVGRTLKLPFKPSTIGLGRTQHLPFLPDLLLVNASPDRSIIFWQSIILKNNQIIDNNHALHDIHLNFLSGIKKILRDSILALSLQSIVFQEEACST